MWEWLNVPLDTESSGPVRKLYMSGLPQSSSLRKKEDAHSHHPLPQEGSPTDLPPTQTDGQATTCAHPTEAPPRPC